MSEEFDLSELKKYIQGQVDLGSADVFFDEPWVLEKKRVFASASKTVSPIQSQPKTTSMSIAIPSKSEKSATIEKTAVPIFSGTMPTPRVAKQTAAEFESVESLNAFYDSIAKEQIYAQAKGLFHYEGPEHPKLLLLFANPSADILPGKFMQSPVGEMLSRLFASLNVSAESIGVTFFYKEAQAKAFPPLIETHLRKMLTKELQFIAPQAMVTFGEPLFHQLFGKGKNFNDLAGTDMNFAEIKTCSLVDAFAMANDKQLKLLTWKVHIPRSTCF